MEAEGSHAWFRLLWYESLLSLHPSYKHSWHLPLCIRIETTKYLHNWLHKQILNEFRHILACSLKGIRAMESPCNVGWVKGCTIWILSRTVNKPPGHPKCFHFVQHFLVHHTDTECSKCSVIPKCVCVHVCFNLSCGISHWHLWAMLVMIIVFKLPVNRSQAMNELLVGWEPWTCCLPWLIKSLTNCLTHDLSSPHTRLSHNSVLKCPLTYWSLPIRCNESRVLIYSKYYVELQLMLHSKCT